MKRKQAIAGIALIGVAAWAAAALVTRPPVPPALDAADPEVSQLIRGRARVVRLLPMMPQPWRALGHACEANDFNASALIAYERSLARWSRHAPTWYRLSRVHQRAGDADAALEALAQARRLAPGYAPLGWREGDIHLQEGRVDEAEAAYTSALAIDGDAQAATFGLARVALMRGDWEDVLARLAPWQITMGPNAAYAHHLRGRAYRHLGNEARARIELAQGGQQPPSFRDPWSTPLTALRRGRSSRFEYADELLARGRTEQAVAIYAELHEAHPEDPDIASNLAFALLKADRIADAEPLLDAAAVRSPDHVGIQLNLVTVHERSERFDTALEHANRAIELSPALGAAYEIRGIVHVRRNEPDDALADFEEAARLDPNRVDALVWAGMIRQERGEHASAADAFTRASQRNPAKIDAWIRLAISRLELGDQVQAAAALAVARELDADHPMVIRLSQRIPLDPGSTP